MGKVLKVEMIVENKDQTQDGWTSKQAESLHAALSKWLQTTGSIWGYAHTEWYTLLISSEVGEVEAARMNQIAEEAPQDGSLRA